jgi:hypothetical protein
MDDPPREHALDDLAIPLMHLARRFVAWQLKHQVHWRDNKIAPLERAARAANERDFLQRLILGNPATMEQARAAIRAEGTDNDP